jgi:hypothetical protein
MPTITLPGANDTDWGTKYNTAINAINTAVNANSSDIGDIETALEGKSPTTHTHSNYATKTDLSGLETVVNGKANTSHTHTIANITDLANLVASVAGTPTLAIVGLDQDNATIRAIASHNTVAPFVFYDFEIKFGTSDTYYPRPTINEAVMQKPPSNWSGWSANNDCTLTVKVTVRNPFTGTTSTQATATVTCKQYAPITAEQIASAIVDSTVSLGKVVDGVSSKVLVEVSAIQSAT